MFKDLWEAQADQVPEMLNFLLGFRALEVISSEQLEGHTDE
jgi:hypothetical protein